MIRHIIVEEINKLLTENFFASKNKKECFKMAKTIFSNVKKYKLKYKQEKEFVFFDSMTFYSFPLQKNESCEIFVICNDKYGNRNENAVYKAYYDNFSKKIVKKSISMYISPTTTIEEIFDLLSHEITHLLDYEQENISDYKLYRYQTNGIFSKFPNVDYRIAQILYRLWDTTEFNAYQANLARNDYINNIIECLEEINKDESIDWNLVKELLIDYGVKQITKFTNLQTVKKYFFLTSFKKLKKFIKKLKNIEYEESN